MLSLQGLAFVGEGVSFIKVAIEPPHHCGYDLFDEQVEPRYLSRRGRGFSLMNFY